MTPMFMLPQGRGDKAKVVISGNGGVILYPVLTSWQKNPKLVAFIRLEYFIGKAVSMLTELE